MAPGWQVERALKRDAFGRVELVRREDGARAIRRVACGGRIPLTRFVARRLARREVRALRALEGLSGVPALVAAESGTLLRSYVEGSALHQAEALPRDFFDRLDELVLALHARGVCHNDLHKEQNVLVARDGRPWIVDYQLASVHRRGGRLFASRAREDLRHVEKHRRRYTRDGRGPSGGETERGRGQGLRRSLPARAWKRGVKPVYNWLTRRVLRWSDAEARRPSSGPWPRWTEAVGPSCDGSGPHVAPGGSRRECARRND